MAKKKLKTELISETGEVNLTGTTRLDFSLNKNDIIEFFLVEQEEELQANIAAKVAEIKEFEDEATRLRSEFDKRVHNEAIRAQHRLIKNVHKALDKLVELGFRANGRGIDHVSVSFKGLRMRASKQLPDLQRRREYDSRGRWIQVGSSVSESCGHLAHMQFRDATCFYKLDIEEDEYGRTEVALNIGGAIQRTPTFVEWDDKMKEMAADFIDAHNNRVQATRDLYDLLVRHDSLPQLKKKIKKQVVGRVLKNTEEGQLMLAALKGIKKAGANLLTMVEESAESGS